jgi:hypothetical protein
VVGIAHPPDDEPGGDRVIGAGERGEGDLGDFGVGNQVAGVGIDHRAGVAHRDPGVVADGGDRGVHRGVLGQGERELAPGLAHRGDDLAVAVGRVAAHEDVSGSGGLRGVDRFGDHARGALGGSCSSGAQPNGGDHGRRRRGADRHRER